MNKAGESIKSVSEYLERIKDVYEGKELLWFRGQSKDYEQLIPKIFRKENNIDLEESIYYRFQANAIPMLDDVPESYFEWLFLMQHYGIPTRLLDWSTDALVALAFAVTSRNDEHNGSHAAVYCLEPYKLNKQFSESYEKPDKFIPSIIMKEVESIFSFEKNGHYQAPIACIGPLNNTRIIAQKGVFTLSPKRQKNFCLKELSEENDFMTLIDIDDNYIKEITIELQRLGITEGSLYPSLENLATELNKEFNL